MAVALSVYTDMEWPIPCINNFLICNHSKTWIVLQLWCWLATKVYVTYPHVHPPEKYMHKNKHCCLVVNLDCVPQWLINPLALLLWLCCPPLPPPHSLFPLLLLPPYSNSLSRPSDHSSGSDFELTLGQGNSVVVRVISCNSSNILYPSFKFSNYIATFTWTSEITLWY